MLEGKLKDAARRCVLRPIGAASKCGYGWGAYSAPPDPLAGFEEGIRE